MQVVIHFGFYKIAYIFIHRRSGGLSFLRDSGPHVVAPKLGFSLTLEHRFFHVDGYSRHQSVTNICEIEILVEELLNSARQMLLQRTLVRTALGRMLTVDKRIILLAILVGMRKGYLNVLTLQMHNVVQPLAGHVVFQQILQTVTRQDALTIIYKGKPRVQIGVIAQQVFHKLRLEGVAHEQRIIGLEKDVSTCLFRRFLRHIADQYPTFKDCGAHMSVTIATHLKTTAQRIDRFDAHAVQAHAFLESLRVILTTGVQFADRLDKFALRNAAPIIAHTDPEIVLDVDLNLLARSHLELVDAVIQRFLQQHINTVIALASVPQTADVHAGADTDMLHVIQMSDVLVRIGYVVYRGIVFQW